MMSPKMIKKKGVRSFLPNQLPDIMKTVILKYKVLEAKWYKLLQCQSVSSAPVVLTLVRSGP